MKDNLNTGEVKKEEIEFILEDNWLNCIYLRLFLKKADLFQSIRMQRIGIGRWKRNCMMIKKFRLV